MLSEVYGFTPEQVGNLTLSQFNHYRAYAYRARIENLMGEHTFADKHRPWNFPGYKKKKAQQVDQLGAILKSMQRQTGKKQFSSSELRL